MIIGHDFLYLLLMKRIERQLLIFLFLAFYLTPTLELDHEESKTNYANECHQYIHAQNEHGSTVIKTAKHSLEQRYSLFYQPDGLSYNFARLTSSLLDEFPTPQKIFLLHSILII